MKALLLLPLLAFVATMAIAVSGFGTRFGVWDFRAGFQILRWGVFAALALAAVVLIALLVPKLRAGRVGMLGIALVMAVGAATIPLYWLQLARNLPPINDITTDLERPPAFAAVVSMRRDAPVPAAYPGEATANAQRKGYPDLQPAVVAKAPGAAFETALAAARQMGWDIVDVDPAAGRIEATATTPWFGFKDDVVIRVAPAGKGSRIDIRSVSRIGKNDLGSNARRVRAFVAEVSK